MENGNVDNMVENVDNTQEAHQTEETVDYEKLYQSAARSVSELTAERDSLLTENKELREAKDAAIADSAKIKEMNYTLSRQLNIIQDQKKQPEQLMAEMFLKKGV